VRGILNAFHLVFKSNCPDSVVLSLGNGLEVVRADAVVCKQVTMTKELRLIAERQHEMTNMAFLRAAKANKHLLSAFMILFVARTSHANKAQVVTNSSAPCRL
jgi:hypothetical protein